MAAQRIDVAAIIDRQSMSGFQLRLLLWIAVAMFVEGYDMQVVGYAAPSIIRAWHIERSSFGLVFAAAMAGYMVGALALSNLGDRIGRRVLVITGVLGFGALTVAAAYAQTPTELTVLRFLAGVGLGGAIPKRHRAGGRVCAERAAGDAGGRWCSRPTRSAVRRGGFIAAGLLPRFGWQSRVPCRRLVGTAAGRGARLRAARVGAVPGLQRPEPSEACVHDAAFGARIGHRAGCRVHGGPTRRSRPARWQSCSAAGCCRSPACSGRPTSSTWWRCTSSRAGCRPSCRRAGSAWPTRRSRPACSTSAAPRAAWSQAGCWINTASAGWRPCSSQASR